MAGNPHGAMKAAARRLGMSAGEYASRILRGEKWCGRCRVWKKRGAFGNDSTRGDGLTAACLECREVPERDGPGRRERAARALRGQSWCRDCAAWRDDARQGLCRSHKNADYRRRYATDPAFRAARLANTMRHARGVEPVPPEAAEMLLEDFAGTCAYCERPADTWDHIFPVVRGGKTEPWNIVPACKSCNSRKKDKDPYVWLDSIPPEKVALVVERMVLAEMPTRFHVAMCGA